MPVVDPTQLVWDGFTSVETGMNNGAAPNRLPPLQAALLINATARGNFATQRPGFRRVMTVLQTPPGMFQHFGEFLTDSGRQYLVVVCNGQFYRVDPIAKTVAEITIPGDRNPSNLRRGWSVHAETFWIYNDGQTLPFIWTGGSARRAGKGEIQPGTVIAYVQGRLWYALPDGGRGQSKQMKVIYVGYRGSHQKVIDGQIYGSSGRALDKRIPVSVSYGDRMRVRIR